MKITKRRFKSGKYSGKLYIDVWQTNPDYFYWLAENVKGFWPDVVKQFEQRDNQINSNQSNQSNKHNKFPSIDQVRKIFKSNPICGFDLSDHICEIYEFCPDYQKLNYFNSLLKRNNIKL